jgi:phenylacetate-CoA ligase
MSTWNPKMEFMPKEELDKLQLKLLKALVHRLYDYSPFYRQRMDEGKVHPDHIRSTDDAAKLPFMQKRDLRELEPSQLFMASNRELVRYHASSGTTGRPTIVGYTQKDVDTWTESVARGIASAGVSADDILQVAYTYGLFTGGLGLHYGAERLGCTVVPASTGNSERQLDMIKRLGVTAIACTPSYLMHLGEMSQKIGLDIRNDTNLRLGILGAEPGRCMRKRMEDGLESATSMGPGASRLASECMAAGMHVWGSDTWTWTESEILGLRRRTGRHYAIEGGGPNHPLSYR